MSYNPAQGHGGTEFHLFAEIQHTSVIAKSITEDKGGHSKMINFGWLIWKALQLQMFIFLNQSS
jgi:hypothetical protein